MVTATAKHVMEIAGRKIGGGAPCFVIAEAGVNHNGNLDDAHRLVDAAADTGSDAVKFQTWITEEICSRKADKADYQKLDNSEESQFDMLKRLELPFAWHAELKAHAEERGIMFLSTPDDLPSARFLCSLGVAAIKVGSAELTNLPHLVQLALFGRPLVLSTGMANTDQVAAALEAIWSANESCQVALLHCVSIYPAPEEDMNLKCIETLRNRFGVPTGLSDHTVGSMAAVLAVGLGMSVYEKHLTLDRSKPGPDQAASTEPGEFAAIVAAIRKAERMLGTGIKGATAKEKSIAAAVQRVLVYAQDLHRGHVLSAQDLKPLRSGEPGLGPSEAARLIGKRLNTDVSAWSVVKEVDLAAAAMENMAHTVEKA